MLNNVGLNLGIIFFFNWQNFAKEMFKKKIENEMIF